ncbi:hypothetical protein ACPA9J_05055 [Pseudomonas aeruginosa]
MKQALLAEARVGGKDKGGKKGKVVPAGKRREGQGQGRQARRCRQAGQADQASQGAFQAEGRQRSGRHRGAQT